MISSSLNSYANQYRQMPYSSEELNKQELKTPTQILQRIDLSNTDYQLGMGIASYKPNAIKTSQYQNGPEVLYVLNGEITYCAKGKNSKIIKKGESYKIPAGEVHYSQAGPNGADILASWILQKNKPFAIPIS